MRGVSDSIFGVRDMSDLIDRQVAIDELHGKDPSQIWDTADIEVWLNTLPSAPPKKVCVAEIKLEIDDLKDYIDKAINAERWIPCERELPEVGRSVLISVGGMYTAEGCLREDGDWAQFRWDAIQRKDMVGAWKPLPEPYKGEQE